MDDSISRQAAIDRINKQREHLKPDIDERDAIGDAAYRVCAEFIERLPSAPPEFTDSEIQELEQAQIKKAYELGFEEGKESARREAWEDGRDRLD